MSVDFFIKLSAALIQFSSPLDEALAVFKVAEAAFLLGDEVLAAGTLGINRFFQAVEFTGAFDGTSGFRESRSVVSVPKIPVGACQGDYQNKDQDQLELE